MQLILSILCVVALLVAERAGARPAVAVAKLAASSCFVWAAVAWGALASGYGLTVLAGLALCWLGDALLIPRGQGLAFQLGIGAFLLGHVAYALAFAQLGVNLLALGAAALALGMLVVRVMRWLGPHVPGGSRAPVRLYIGVISVMVAAALAAVAAGQPAAIAVGALGFAASDVSVARDRFVAPSWINGAWGLPLYFASQLLLASSIWHVAART